MFLDRFLWFCVILILFGQSILQDYSIVSNIALLIISIRQTFKLKLKEQSYLVAFLIWIALLFFYSILRGNEISLAFRFCLVILFVLYSYLWKVDSQFFFKCITWISGILVLCLIGLEIFMFTLSFDEYQAFRDGVINLNKMGDVFWYGIYYKLELLGTPLIVFVYMLSYVISIFPSRFEKILRIFYLTGVILAGNFAYQLALVVFHLIFYVYNTIRNKHNRLRRLVFLLIISLSLGGALFIYISNELKAKSDFSTATRKDFVEVLYNDMSEDCISLLFGTGMGHTINVKTSYRDYRGNTYFEIQSMYIFNQLGLINFTMLILLNILLAFWFIKDKRLMMIYGIYVLYASTNPYIWDTNHIVVIVSLLCGKLQIKQHGDLYQCKVPVLKRSLIRNGQFNSSNNNPLSS